MFKLIMEVRKELVKGKENFEFLLCMKLILFFKLLKIYFFRILLIFKVNFNLYIYKKYASYKKLLLSFKNVGKIIGIIIKEKQF